MGTTQDDRQATGQQIPCWGPFDLYELPSLTLRSQQLGGA